MTIYVAVTLHQILTTHTSRIGVSHIYKNQNAVLFFNLIYIRYTCNSCDKTLQYYKRSAIGQHRVREYLAARP